MNYIDILLLIPLLYGAYKGFSKGLIIEVATFLGLVLGVYVAIKFSGYTEVLLRDFLDLNSKYLSYIALSVTFLLVVIAIHILGKMLTKLIDLISLGLINKLLGIWLGLMKYFIVLCVILLLVNALDDKFHFIRPETRSGSLLYNPILRFAQTVYEWIRR